MIIVIISGDRTDKRDGTDGPYYHDCYSYSYYIPYRFPVQFGLAVAIF